MDTEPLLFPICVALVLSRPHLQRIQSLSKVAASLEWVWKRWVERPRIYESHYRGRGQIGVLVDGAASLSHFCYSLGDGCSFLLYCESSDSVVCLVWKMCPWVGCVATGSDMRV